MSVPVSRGANHSANDGKVSNVSNVSNVSSHSTVGSAGGEAASSPDLSSNRSGPKCRVLTSGVDSLNLTVWGSWSDECCLDRLADLKSRIVGTRDKAALTWGGQSWLLSPFGRRGMEYVLTCAEYTIEIGDWQDRSNFPNLKIEIRSETLHHLGPFNCIKQIREMLQLEGFKLEAIKPSRADLHIDFIASIKDVFNMDILYSPIYRVCRAAKIGSHHEHNRFTGVDIGYGGVVACRFYDKIVEINKSGKSWMWDVWNVKLDELEMDETIIRVEVQFRREALKELDVDTIEDFLNHVAELWSYFSKKWITFRLPGVNIRYRKTLEWWKTIQEGFMGLQNVCPAVRGKSLKMREKQLKAQLKGNAEALALVQLEKMGVSELVLDDETIFQIIRKTIEKEVEETGYSFTEGIKAKRAKVQRKITKINAVLKARAAFGMLLGPIPEPLTLRDVVSW